MKKNKKIYYFCVILILLLLCCNVTLKCKEIIANKTKNLNEIASQNVFCQNDEEDETKKQLEDNINNQLNDIDFSQIDKIFSSLSDSSKNFLGENSFVNIVKKFINADDSNLYNNFLPYALSIIFDNLLGMLPYFSVIVAIAILYSLIGQFSNEKDKSLNNMIHLVCFSVIAIIVTKIVFGLLTNATNSISLIQNQMEALFPIILTLITATKNVVTATTFQPLLAILSNGITKLFTAILVPIFIFSIVFNIVGNLSNNIKLEKFSKFFSSLFSWIVGIVFTVFVAFLTLHGLTVSSVDSISIKTAKYAIKNYVPILGSYLSDGVGLILASTTLIKNAIGVSGLVILFAVVFSPIIQIVIVQLLFKLISAILEPLCDKGTTEFLFSISKSLNMLIVCLLAIGFMYLISMSILMCCSNFF